MRDHNRREINKINTVLSKCEMKCIYYWIEYFMQRR